MNKTGKICFYVNCTNILTLANEFPSCLLFTLTSALLQNPLKLVAVRFTNRDDIHFNNKQEGSSLPGLSTLHSILAFKKEIRKNKQDTKTSTTPVSFYTFYTFTNPAKRGARSDYL